MDNDDYRRGQPTCHKKFGESQAILAGDALQSLAFEVLSSDKLNIVSNNKTSIIHFFANAIGAKGMVLGQSQDMIFTGQTINIKQLSEMQLLKTGKLFELACVCPVLINSAIDNTNVKKFQKLGALIGKMYQITDDILDATISSDQLGKTSGKDQDTNKQTYVTIFGIEESKKINNKIFQEIKLLISVLKRDLTQLSMLIDYIFERKF
jgi:farnesyl diphosphate synthase